MRSLNTVPKSLQVVVPVLDEQTVLAASISEVHRYLSNNFYSYNWTIRIVDNGSTDATQCIAARLCSELSNVVVTVLKERGRGRAIGRAWIESCADISVYMDVDLSTEMQALPKLVDAIENNGYDIAIASRLQKGAKVIGRSFHRELISRAYSLIVRLMFLMDIRDYQCGFKAVSRRAVRDLVVLVRDTGWFFDSELIILAYHNRYRISEIPVTWADDSDSRVKIISTALSDVKGLLRLRFGGLRQASRSLDVRDGHESG